MLHDVSPEGADDAEGVGSGLLNEVRDAVRRFCVLPGEHELVAVVLWCALSHLLTQFDYAPRLVIRSAEKRSGKSRLLEVIDALVYSPLRAVNTTVAFVFRSLEIDPPPTLLFDEVDTIFGSKGVSDKNEELRGLLNAGFQRGLPFGRVCGTDLSTQQFSPNVVGDAPEAAVQYQCGRQISENVCRRAYASSAVVRPFVSVIRPTPRW
jgi:hypothetical protein